MGEDVAVKLGDTVEVLLEVREVVEVFVVLRVAVEDLLVVRVLVEDMVVVRVLVADLVTDRVVVGVLLIGVSLGVLLAVTEEVSLRLGVLETEGNAGGEISPSKCTVGSQPHSKNPSGQVPF